MDDQENACGSPHAGREPPAPDAVGPDLQQRIEALTRSIADLHADIVATGREQVEARTALGGGSPPACTDEG